eukprot:scaffold5289_cov107-Cylindrotheca_fusiformis.AAC.9
MVKFSTRPPPTPDSSPPPPPDNLVLITNTYSRVCKKGRPRSWEKGSITANIHPQKQWVSRQ